MIEYETVNLHGHVYTVHESQRLSKPLIQAFCEQKGLEYEEYLKKIEIMVPDEEKLQEVFTEAELHQCRIQRFHARYRLTREER